MITIKNSDIKFVWEDIGINVQRKIDYKLNSWVFIYYVAVTDHRTYVQVSRNILDHCIY